MPDAFALANAFVRIRPDTSGFRAEAQAGIKAALEGVNAKVKVTPDIAGFKTATAAAIKSVLSGLTSQYTLKLKADPASLQYVRSMTTALRKLSDAMAATSAAAGAGGKGGGGTVVVTGGGGGAGGGWGAFFNAMRTGVPLFGTAARSGILFASAWQLAAHWALETAAVVIPATIAMIAFGAAGYAAGTEIFGQMQNINTVMTATNKVMYPFTGNFKKLQDAARPAVYQAFGDAIVLASQKSGLLMQIVKGTGVALDQLLARATVALKSNALGLFAQYAVKDFYKLGTVIGNIFGTIGNLLHAVPGYAQILLNSLVGVTHGVEVLTGTAGFQGLFKVLLYGHGAFIYAGLAATAFAFGMGKLLPLLSKGLDVMSFGAQKAKLFGGASRFAAAGLADMSDAATAAAGLPWGWIAFAATALGVLVYELVTMKDATQGWFAAQEAVIMQAPAVKGYTLLLATQADVANRLGNAEAGLAQSMALHGRNLQLVNAKTGQTISAYHGQMQVISELTSDQHLLAAQSDVYSVHLAKLALIFGGTSEAQAILIASGVKMSQMLDTSTLHWMQLLEQVQATQAAYKAMGQTGGVLGADLNALNIAASDQYTAMQKINQAFDTVLGAVSGGQGAFITFQQSLNALRPLARAAGASMDGLNNASLSLRSGWQTAYQNGLKLMDALRTMQSISPGGFPSVTRAAKDTLAELIPLGKTSAATRFELVSMAQEINPGIRNFHDLVRWLGNTRNAGKDLNKLLSVMGGNLQNLAADAAGMASTLQKDVLNQFAQDKLASAQVSKALQQVAFDTTHLGVSAAQKHKDMVTLYNDLVKAGVGAKQAQALIEGMTGAIFKIPKARTFSIIELGLGKFGITQSTFNAVAKASLRTGYDPKLIGGARGGLAGSARFGKFAEGGAVSGSGYHDTIPALLMPGEVVVPRRMVAGGAVDHLRGSLPGFADGGLVTGGDKSVLTGRATGAFDHQFRVQMTKAFTGIFATSMLGAISAAEARARAAAERRAAIGFFDSGARSGSAAIAQSFAYSILPRGWSFADLLALWNRESGWNAYAVNPSSGAYGIPQCYSTDMMILTRRGWLKHDEVRVGDETVGYNPATGRSEWTRVTAVLHPGVHRVVRYGNSRLSFTTTPNHRWLMYEKHSRAESMRAIQDRLWRNSLVLAKPATTGPGLPITDQEAALLGWIAGDGWERKAYGKYGTGRRGGSPATFHIAQTKQANWPAIEAAADEHGRVVRTRERTVKGEPRLDREWRLSAPYARDLVERAGHPRNDCVRLVTAMSDSQRAAWLDALFMAEGHTEAGNRTYSQNQGALADAIKLALYLEGLRPSWYERHDARYGTTNLAIRGVKPTLLVGHPGFFYEDAGETEVWCVTTELGTFTAEQNGHIHLTGNSLGHGHPFNLGDYKAQVMWGINYIAGRYGDSQAAWAHEAAYGWYDKGGWLPPGLSVAWNGTGAAERVYPSGGGEQRIVLEFRGGGGGFDQFMVGWIRENVRVRGGGDVQVAFGR